MDSTSVSEEASIVWQPSVLQQACLDGALTLMFGDCLVHCSRDTGSRYLADKSVMWTTAACKFVSMHDTGTGALPYHLLIT